MNKDVYIIGYGELAQKIRFSITYAHRRQRKIKHFHAAGVITALLHYGTVKTVTTTDVIVYLSSSRQTHKQSDWLKTASRRAGRRINGGVGWQKLTTRDILTDITEAASPAVDADPGPVLGAAVVSELVTPRVAGQRTTTSVVAGVTEQTVGDPRRRATTTITIPCHHSRVSDQCRLVPRYPGLDRVVCTQPIDQLSAYTDHPPSSTTTVTGARHSVPQISAVLSRTRNANFRDGDATVYSTCSRKLTWSQRSLLSGIKQKI